MSATRGRRVGGFTIIEALVVLAIIAILAALLLPAVRSGREPARRMQCNHNLKQITLALHNYHDVYGVFPPAYTTNDAGEPLHSWRTLILPFLDQQALYDQIDLSKPWNDPANEAATGAHISIYVCPSTAGLPGLDHTTYLAVVAPESCLRPVASASLEEVADTSTTLLLIEVDAKHAVPWMAPQDADEAFVMGFNTETAFPHSGGTHAAFVDGSVQFLSSDMPPEERRPLFTITGDKK